jgi:hypothetical protein
MSAVIRRGSGIASMAPVAYLSSVLKAPRPGGQDVCWYDPADKSTLFQSGGAPVTASGQEVAQMLDKLGSNHVTFDAGKRPIYTESGGLAYLDGTSGTAAGYTAAIDLTAWTRATVVVGVNKLSDTLQARVFEFGNAPATDSGSISIGAPGGAAVTNFQVFARGATTGAGVAAINQAAPKTGVITGLLDFAADTLTIRFNGIQRDSMVAGMGGGTLGNEALFIFARNNGASLQFPGHFYGAYMRAGDVPDALRNAAEAFHSLRTGVY